MNFKNLMENRYTTKVYDASKKLDAQQIQELKEILRLSPSSINSQPWKFIFVRDKAVKKSLAEASLFNAAKVLHCDTLVVFARVDNLSTFEADIAQWLAPSTNEYYRQNLKPLGDQALKNWFDKQLYLSLGIFLSACASMNIDFTAMEGIEIDKYNQILSLTNFTSVFAVAIGHRDQKEDFNQLDKKPKSRKPFGEVIEEI